MNRGLSLAKSVGHRIYATVYRHPWVVRTITRHFHRAYYASDNTYLTSTWRGVRILKCPLDLWIYQEILQRTAPELVIETGTAHGGSAYFFASLFDLLGVGEVITIDIDRQPGLPQHPRITYLHGSSTDPAVVARVQAAARAKTRVMVVLDSDHSERHVLAEMRLYWPLVGLGHYLVVEDTHMGHPVPPFTGRGPREAVRRFLQENQEFISDLACERLLLSFNPGGYLKRVPPASGGQSPLTA